MLKLKKKKYLKLLIKIFSKFQTNCNIMIRVYFYNISTKMFCLFSTVLLLFLIAILNFISFSSIDEYKQYLYCIKLKIHSSNYQFKILIINSRKVLKDHKKCKIII